MSMTTGILRANQTEKDGLVWCLVTRGRDRSSPTVQISGVLLRQISQSSLCFRLDCGAAFWAHKMDSFWMQLNVKMCSNCSKAPWPWVKSHNAQSRTKFPTPTFTPQSCSHHITILASTDTSVSTPHSCSLANLSSAHMISPASFDSFIYFRACITEGGRGGRKTDNFPSYTAAQTVWNRLQNR